MHENLILVVLLSSFSVTFLPNTITFCTPDLFRILPVSSRPIRSRAITVDSTSLVIPMKRLIDRIQVDEVSQKSQQDILEAVLNTAEGEDDIDHLDDDEILSQPDEEESDDEYVPPAEGHRSTFRPIRNISGRGTDMLSGGAGLAYAEVTS